MNDQQNVRPAPVIIKKASVLEAGMPFKEVSYQQLVTTMGGALNFTLDDLLAQVDDAEAEGDDFRLISKGIVYVVRLSNIKEFFLSHARPVRAMTPVQEIAFLKRQIEDLKKSMVSNRVDLAGDLLAKDDEPIIDEGAIDPERITVARIMAPPPAPSIAEPAPDPKAPKETVAQIQARLASELAAKRVKAVTRNTQVVDHQTSKVVGDKPDTL
jgi:hypothetical protein